MRIVSWNILQGGGKRARDIGDTLSQWAPDLLILQEFRHGASAQIIRETMNDLGLTHQYSTPSEPRKNCICIASRTQMTCEPWAEKLDARLALHAKSIEEPVGFNLLAGHLPHKRAQVPYFEALLDQTSFVSGSALVIGDLNCGIPFEDSDTKTFDNTHLFQALLQQGWVDSWRSRNPDAREFTWISTKGNGYRYDHCLSSPDFDRRLTHVEYDHHVRETGLSDHSALLLRLDLK